MADAFIGEVRIFCGNFAPTGWAFCNGQLLPISQYTALFSLLGTNYGGNGTSNFALPNLQASFPLHAGGSGGPGLTHYVTGEALGAPTVTLLQSQMPAHHHALNAVPAPSAGTPAATLALAPTSDGKPIYRAPGSPRTLAPAALAAAGGSQPHENRQPFLALNFIIALQGIYPPRN